MPPPPADRGEKRADLAGAALGLLRSAAGLLAGSGGEDAGVRDVWFTEVDAAGVQGFKEVQNSQLAEALTEADVFSCEEMQAFGIDMSFWVREDPAERKYYIRVQDRRLQMHAGVWDEDEGDEKAGMDQNSASSEAEIHGMAVVPSNSETGRLAIKKSNDRRSRQELQKFIVEQKFKTQEMERDMKDMKARLNAAEEQPSTTTPAPAVEINDKLQAAVTKAIHDGVSGALHDLAPRHPPRSPSPEPADTVLGLDADFLASIAQSARFGRGVTSHDILCAGMAATLTLCAAKQMTLEYRRRFNRPAPALDAIDADALPGYSREVLLAFKLVDVCLKPNWTRVGTQKRIELEFYAAVKGLVEASLAR